MNGHPDPQICPVCAHPAHDHRSLSGHYGCWALCTAIHDPVLEGCPGYCHCTRYCA